MKIKDNILLFLVMSSLMVFVACSEEDRKDNPPIIDGEETPDLSIKEKAIVLKVGNQEAIDITQGGGEYKAFTLNKEIASVEQMDEKLTVSGRGNGKTDLIISDGNNQYRKIAVTVYTYEELKLNVPKIDISFKLGSLPAPSIIRVLQGNGSYTATSEHLEIATVSVQRETIEVSPAGKAGSTNITVTDFMGFTATIPITVSISVNPFTQSDLKSIMGNATLRYTVSNGETKSNNAHRYLTYFNSTEEGRHTFGYEYIDNVYDEALGEYVEKATFLFDLSFEGDRTVGIKQNGKFSYRSAESEYAEEFIDQPVSIEIIKNENRKIWGIFYFVNGNSIFFGHFCQSATPM